MVWWKSDDRTVGNIQTTACGLRGLRHNLKGKDKNMIDTSVFQGKTAAYYTLGCKLNFSETSTFGQMLQELGVRTVGDGEQADICLLNPCSVTDVADLVRP